MIRTWTKVLVACFLLASCGQGANMEDDGGGDVLETGSPEIESGSAAGEDQAAAFDFVRMRQAGYWAVIIPEDVDSIELEVALRAHCGMASNCQILGWTDPRFMARAMPMTNREVEELAFSFMLNRASGFEQMVWDCRRFPQPDPINCIE